MLELNVESMYINISNTSHTAIAEWLSRELSVEDAKILIEELKKIRRVRKRKAYYKKKNKKY